MNRRILALVPVLGLTVSLCSMGACADAMNFTDVVEGSWYEDYVQYCYDHGLMQGTGTDTFEPGTATTRATIIQTLYNLEDQPAVSGSSGFDDVVSGAWYEDALLWGEEYGIATGYGDGTFGPGDVVTREQLATFLYRYADIAGYDTDVSADLSGYSDEDEISGWAYDAMEWAVGSGLIKGTSDTMVSPGDDATRAELATILTRFCGGEDAELVESDAEAADEDVYVVDSGTCGDTAAWVLTSDGTLTVSGSGDMDDFNYSYGTSWFYLYSSEIYSNMPWSDYRTSITDVVVEEGITRIGNCAFFGCDSLERITIPDSVTIVGFGAFYECISLESIVIPDQVTTINYQTFYGCTGLKSAVISENLTTIADYAFYGCSALESLVLPENVTSIGDYAFYDCSSLAEINIPGHVTSIGEYAFYNCQDLEDISLPDTLTGLGEYAFYNCISLTDLTIPGSVATISDYAFCSCKNLETVVIQDGVEAIGAYAFDNCISMTDITIPDSVAEIDEYAFYGCNSLEDVWYSGTEPEWESIDLEENEDDYWLSEAAIHYNS